MRPRIALAVLALSCAAPPLLGQGNGKTNDQHGILQQVLTQIYQPSDVGKRLMGVGAETDVRRAGTLVVIQQEGLWGSFLRSEIASSAIHGPKAELYRGHEDYAVPVGERFYVISVHVGEDTIDIGMLSARAISAKNSTARVWTLATFYFPAEVVARADKDAVLREIGAWFLPEGHINPSSNSSADANDTRGTPLPQAAIQPGPSAKSAVETLKTGMTREEILAAIGKPRREITFKSQTWMHYPGMVVVLNEEKLSSVEDGGALSTAHVTFRSEPDGAEIFLDGHLVGTTQSTLELPAGNHQLTLRLTGHQDWVREVLILAGSDTHFDAKFDQP